MPVKKTAASLPIIVAEERGKDSQNGRRLTWAEMDHIVPVEI
jgi:hypothetical protein